MNKEGSTAWIKERVVALMKFVSEQTISDNFIPILYQHHFLLIVCSNK
jgi:hypothetical protein